MINVQDVSGQNQLESEWKFTYSKPGSGTPTTVPSKSGRERDCKDLKAISKPSNPKQFPLEFKIPYSSEEISKFEFFLFQENDDTEKPYKLDQSQMPATISVTPPKGEVNKNYDWKLYIEVKCRIKNEDVFQDISVCLNGSRC